MASVTFERVDKVYPGGTLAVDGLDLHIADGEFMVLVGPSGCGKTTALRMVAGLEAISEGTLRIGERIVNELEPRKRDIAMVFQNYALYPNMSVFDNIGFGLKIRRVGRAEIRRRVEEIARILDLSELLGRKPAMLSGGQRQRVAMGRAIIRDPSVFLMDEPLSNLDAKLRVQMRAEIARIQRKVGATTIYVTHDQVEAMTMGTRVAVMRKGVLQQVAAPRDLYARPVNLFVAGFIGSPAMTLMQVRVEQNGAGLVCRLGGQALPLPEGTDHSPLAPYAGRTVALGIRPEHLGDAIRDTGPSVPRIRGRVTAIEILGAEVLVHAEVEATPVATAEVRELAEDVDASALQDLEAVADKGSVTVVARYQPETRLAIGDVVELPVDTRRLHFFDLQSSVAIG